MGCAQFELNASIYSVHYLSAELVAFINHYIRRRFFVSKDDLVGDAQPRQDVYRDNIRLVPKPMNN